jgi:hypothetical protein
MARDDTAPAPIASVRPMAAGDVVQLALQPSQHKCLGMTRVAHSIEDGQELVAGGPAWTAIGRHHDGTWGRILCCAGFTILWPANEKTRGHAMAWAMLAEGLGAAHLAVTRFAQRRIAEAPYSRLEAIVRDVEAEKAWAWYCGFRNPILLRAWGPEGEDHLLYERIV